MEQLGCEICFENYDDLMVVPKMLDCGHTMCGSCIHNMEGKSPQCPTCRTPITRNKKYVTNYSLLSLVQEKKNIRIKEKTIKEEFSEIIGKLKERKLLLTKKLETQQKALQVMEDFLNKLRELKEVDEETDVHTMVSANLSDLARKEKTLKRKLEIVTQCLALMEVQDESEASGCGTSPSSPMRKVPEMKLRILWRDGENNKTYLNGIRERLGDGEVFVQHPYEGKMLYGKLDFEKTLIPGNWIVSALEERELPNGAYIVEFRDLKEALKEDYSLCAFLEFRGKECEDEGIITIELRASPLTELFIKLCSGECGVSYKHCDLEWDEMNDRYRFCYALRSGIPCKEMPQCFREMYRIPSSKSFDARERIVRLDPDGIFTISDLRSSGEFSHVVGVAEFHIPNNVAPFQVGFPYQTKDCGIYFRSKK